MACSRVSVGVCVAVRPMPDISVSRSGVHHEPHALGQRIIPRLISGRGAPKTLRIILKRMTQATDTRRGPEPPDLSEKGGIRNGQPQRSDDRLFMQFLAFGGCPDAKPLAQTLGAAGLASVLYEDVNDPRGVGLLTVTERPDDLVEKLRPVLNGGAFASLVQKPEYTMLGRTYAIGYEPDLKEVLLDRPRRTVLNPAWNWAIWYPL